MVAANHSPSGYRPQESRSLHQRPQLGAKLLRGEPLDAHALLLATLCNRSKRAHVERAATRSGMGSQGMTGTHDTQP